MREYCSVTAAEVESWMMNWKIPLPDWFGVPDRSAVFGPFCAKDMPPGRPLAPKA